MGQGRGNLLIGPGGEKNQADKERWLGWWRGESLIGPSRRVERTATQLILSLSRDLSYTELACIYPHLMIELF